MSYIKWGYKKDYIKEKDDPKKEQQENNPQNPTDENNENSNILLDSSGVTVDNMQEYKTEKANTRRAGYQKFKRIS